MEKLIAAGLAECGAEGKFVTLRSSAVAADVVKLLVQAGHPVHEVAAEEQTLEYFYLSLMEGERAAN